jgi:4-carboxymuconolactone decarboxylase
MPRIEPVEQADEEQAKLLSKSLPGPDGQPLNVFRTLVHRPELMRRINGLGGYFFVHGGIEVRERELVILRTAARVKCAYEIGQHRWIGAKAGLTPEEIEAALDAMLDHRWSNDDAALLAFADELLSTDTVSDVSWEALGGRYDDTHRTELLVLVGYYRMLAGVLNGLQIELDPSVARELDS